MAEQVYNNYRLRRTLTKLSGNMKLDLVVSKSGGSKLVIKQAHLTPVATITPFSPVIDERLMDRPHRLNIKKYYEKTKDSFYEFRSQPELMSDWYWMIPASSLSKLKYTKTWSDEYWAGTQRMSYQLYGTTHEVLMPLWLENAKALKFVISVLADNSLGALATYEIEIAPNKKTGVRFHDDFVQYWLDYMKDAKISESNNNVMQINYKQNITMISGIHAPSGNYVTRPDYNIARNLIFRERPLLEANSLITNAFPDYSMITSQLVNFNICFDANELISGSLKNMFTGEPSFMIKCDAYVPDEDGVYQKLEVRDFYTNHFYVPRQTYVEGYDEGDRSYRDDEHYWKNVLDHLKDYKCTDMIHQNKIVQPICHWVMTDQPDGDLFNVYDGFGAVVIDSNGVEHSYDHGNGLSPDPNVTDYDWSAPNDNWAGIPMYGDGDDVEEVLNNPQRFIDNGCLVDLSNYVNGLQFNYEMDPDDPTSPSKVYVGTMTTVQDSNMDDPVTAHTQLMSNPEYIGILTYRYNGMDPSQNDLPENREQAFSEFDKKYDWHKHADVDNRWAFYRNNIGQRFNGSAEGWTLCNSMGQPVGTNGPNVYLREYDNVGVLYVCTRRMMQYLEDGTLDPHAPLICIFWHHKLRKKFDCVRNAAGEIVSLSDRENYTNLPSGLVLGEILDAIRDYMDEYQDIYEDVQGMPGVPNLDDMGYVTGAMNTLEVPEVIYFNRSILSKIDNTLSNRAEEITYKKYNEANEYVWRYSAKIRPAIFPEKAIRDGDELRYLPTYGRNFLWEKKLIFPESVTKSTFDEFYAEFGEKMVYDLPDGVLKYVSTNVPPRYPSLDYDPVIQSVKYGRNGEFVMGNGGILPSKHGDLMYDEPHPKYLGKDMYGDDLGEGLNDNINAVYRLFKDQYPTWKWFEYKWFDKSRVLTFEHSGQFEITVQDNSKESLEEKSLIRIKENITEDVDIQYLKNIYKIDYLLQDVHYDGALYTYTYKIKYQLK